MADSSKVAKGGLLAGVAAILTALAPLIMHLTSDAEDKADASQATADQSHDTAWKAAWDAFEAREKTEMFSKEAQLRIDFLERRAETSERNHTILLEFVNQIALNRRAPVEAPKLVRVKVPAKLLPEEPWEAAEPPPESEGPEGGSGPSEGMEGASESPMAQQMAPMPSVGEMWDKKAGERKEKWDKKWEKKK